MTHFKLLTFAFRLSGLRLSTVDGDGAAQALADRRSGLRRMYVDDDLVADLELLLGPALPDHDAGAVQLHRVVLALEWSVGHVHEQRGVRIFPRKFRHLTPD